jgi:hypothetical protein
VTSQSDSASRMEADEQGFINDAISEIERVLNEASFSQLDKDGCLTICLEGFGQSKFTESVRTTISKVYTDAKYASATFDHSIQCTSCNRPQVWHFKIKVR